MIPKQHSNELNYKDLPLFVTFQGSDGNSMLSVSHVVSTSVSMCDIDIKPVSINTQQIHVL